MRLSLEIDSVCLEAQMGFRERTMKIRPLIMVAAALGSVGIASSDNGQTFERVVEVQISGGHDTLEQDHGRPVILIASALKVPTQVFREAFSHVHPAPAGQEPDPEQVRRNKEALLNALSRYGVTNDRLDEVSNYYRYNGRREALWKHRDAKVTATILRGEVKKVTVIDGGAGYSSKPTLTVPGVPNAHLEINLAFGPELNSNGSLAKVGVLLPPFASRFSLERTYNIFSDPASIEFSRLRDDNFTVDETSVHFLSVEGDVIFY